MTLQGVLQMIAWCIGFACTHVWHVKLLARAWLQPLFMPWCLQWCLFRPYDTICSCWHRVVEWDLRFCALVVHHISPGVTLLQELVVCNSRTVNLQAMDMRERRGYSLQPSLLWDTAFCRCAPLVVLKLLKFFTFSWQACDVLWVTLRHQFGKLAEM